MPREKGSRTDQTPIMSQRAALSVQFQTIPVPAGLELRSPEEVALWEQFTAVRIPDDWRRADLVMVHRIIQLELRIRGLWDTLDEEGYVIEGKHCDIVNPVLTAISKLHLMQLQLLRLTQLLELPFGLEQQRTKRGKEAEKVRQAVGGEVLDLLAVADPVSGVTRYEPKR